METVTYADFEAFLNSMKGRGVSFLEMLAMELKNEGKYVARGLSFRAAEFSHVPCRLTAEQVWLHFCVDSVTEGTPGCSISEIPLHCIWKSSCVATSGSISAIHLTCPLSMFLLPDLWHQLNMIHCVAYIVGGSVQRSCVHVADGAPGAGCCH